MRVIPIVEFQDCDVSQIVEGASGTIYSRYTKRHPDATRRSHVFPHPDLEDEPTIQAWLKAWPKARFDIFALNRRFGGVGVDFVLQSSPDSEARPEAPRSYLDHADDVPRKRGRPRKYPALIPA